MAKSVMAVRKLQPTENVRHRSYLKVKPVLYIFNLNGCTTTE